MGADQSRQIQSQIQQATTSIIYGKEKAETTIQYEKDKAVTKVNTDKNINNMRIAAKREIEEKQKKIRELESSASLENRIQQKSIVRNLHERITESQNDIDSMLEQYKTNTYAYYNVNQLYNDLLNRNNELEKQIDNSKKNNLTDGRKVYYENEQIDSLKSYQYFIRIIYYILLLVSVLYFILNISTNNKSKKTNSVFMIILILIMIFIPFILKYIIEFLFRFLQIGQTI